GMNRIRTIPGLRPRAMDELIEKLYQTVDQQAGAVFEHDWPELVYFRTAINDMKSNLPILHEALKQEAKRQLAPDAPVADLGIHLEQVREDYFEADTNAAGVLGISPQRADEIVCQALLRLAALSQIYAAMRRYDALTSFDSTDYALLDERVALF